VTHAKKILRWNNKTKMSQNSSEFREFGTWQNSTGKQVQPIDLRSIQQNSAPSGSSRPNIGASGISLPKTAWPIPNKTVKVPPPSNKFKQQSVQQSVQQSAQQSARQCSNAMIISSGDCSDFDGFLALPIYYKAALETGADVYFMMTYPSYLDPIRNSFSSTYESTYESTPGLGYNYGFDVLKQQWSNTYDVKDVIIQYLNLESWNDLNYETYKNGMDKVANDIISIIWDWCSKEIFPNETVPKIYLIDGGYNKINPFNYTSIKNEVYVYGKPLSEIKTNTVQFTSYCLKCTRRQFIIACNKCNQIFMDMNGSMAWYDKDIQTCLEHNSTKMECCVVMGGVEPEISIDTMSSVPNVINRFSTATMNQLYHPERTGAFFSTFADKCIFVSNNAINKYFNWAVRPHEGRKTWLKSKGINNDEYVTFGAQNKATPPILPINFKKDIQKMFNVMFNTNIQDDVVMFNKYMNMLFDAFYTDERLADRKPFDMISAYELYKYLMNQSSINKYDKTTLYFNNEYGITILSNTNIKDMYTNKRTNVYNKFIDHAQKDFEEKDKGAIFKALEIEYYKTKELSNINHFFISDVFIPKNNSLQDLSSKVYGYYLKDKNNLSPNSYTQEFSQQEGGNQRRNKKTPVKYTKTGETYKDSKGISRVLYEKKSSKGIMNSYVKMKNPTTKKFQYKKIS
jgi:hypothetical protein